MVAAMGSALLVQETGQTPKNRVPAARVLCDSSEGVTSHLRRVVIKHAISSSVEALEVPYGGEEWSAMVHGNG